MRHRRKTAALLAVFAVGALTLSACSGGGTSPKNGSSSSSGTAAVFSGAVNGTVNPSTTQGGTIKLLAAGDCDSWDPARTYYGWCFNMQRLFTRTLIGYANVNTSKFKLAPDMATDMGTHNADFTQWKYTLKPGLKYSNGTAIKPADIKWAAERIFATDQINGGPTQYYLDVLKAPSGYKGPYQGKELDSIETTADTITFNLSKPYADFNYLLALPTLAPVPAKVEGGAGYVGGTYTKKPVSSGPFALSSYTPTKSATFTRNKYWKASTDTIHKPLAKEIDLTIDSDPNDIDNKLIAGTADAKADIDIGTTLQTKIFTDPRIKKNADNPATPFTRYLTIPSSVIPNADCRKAIFYATNKAALLQALGGASHGQVAASFTPPSIPGHQEASAYNPFPSGTNNTGDVAKAKAALQACGKPTGFSTKMAYSTPSQTAPKLFAAEQTALARVGIKITPATNDQSTYYSTFAGSPQNVKNQGLGIIVAAWGADFPTGYGFYNSIVNGKNILPTGNSNYGSINNPTINKILDGSTGGKTTEAEWQNLDHALMEDTTGDLPYLWGKSLYYRNPRLTNVACDNALAFGLYDWVNMGVSGS